MEIEKKPKVGIYAILARDSRIGVVFRRGPSKRVLLLLWHTDTDEFIEGQWFKGRIYERRCDLSPSGKRLIYFAAKYKGPYLTWTAVSKPPYLTAVAMWPKGDGWGGGGLFTDEKEISLNHRPAEMKMAEGFHLPKFVAIKPFGEYSGWGEDNPILSTRLIRDGWRFIESGEVVYQSRKAAVWVRIDPPETWAKTGTKKSNSYELRQEIKGIKERNGSWYAIDHSVINIKSGEKISLGKTDWADWCHSGDLLFAKGGKVWRLGFDRDLLQPLEQAKMLIDLQDRVFTSIVAPESARRWGIKP